MVVFLSSSPAAACITVPEEADVMEHIRQTDFFYERHANYSYNYANRGSMSASWKFNGIPVNCLMILMMSHSRTRT